MTPAAPAEWDEEVGPPGAGEETNHPRGTLIVLAAFLFALAVLWTAVYLIMLARGVTS